MSVVDITFPGNLAQVQDAPSLRALPSSNFSDGDLYVVSDNGALYSYDPSSVSVDDGQTVIKPNDLTPLQAGRWLLGNYGLYSALLNLKANIADLSALTGPSLIGYSPTQSYPKGSIGSALAQIQDLWWYGYTADGSSHPLSSVAFFRGQVTIGWTLSQWQAAVPQVTSLTNEIDRVAVQAWYNDRPNGGTLRIYGKAIFDSTIYTDFNQAVDLRGDGRDSTIIKFTGTNSLWRHGWNNTAAASGKFYASDFTVWPASGGASECCFNVRFSGTQNAWCHRIHDVLIIAQDTVSYFTNATITYNIKRGLDWRNFIVYGRNFFVLPSNAHEFPPNVGANCPPGQLQTLAGDSYNFDNCMTVGYNFAYHFDFTGFTSSSAHCHEEGYWTNCQAYSGVGFAQIVDGNTNYAPSDNWVFYGVGWQGTGTALDIEGCEFVRIRDGLFVNNTTTAANHVCYFNLINNRDCFVDSNEIFSPAGSSGITGVYIGGSATQDCRIVNTGISNFATWDQFLYIAAEVTVVGGQERQTNFREVGATYTNARVKDDSTFFVSEQRVKDIITALGGVSPSWDVRPNGDIVYTDVKVATSDASGNISISLPTGLFRGIKLGRADSNNLAVTSTVNVGSITTATMPIRYPGISSATSLSTTIEVIGR